MQRLDLFLTVKHAAEFLGVSQTQFGTGVERRRFLSIGTR